MSLASPSPLSNAEKKAKKVSERLAFFSKDNLGIQDPKDYHEKNNNNAELKYSAISKKKGGEKK